MYSDKKALFLEAGMPQDCAIKTQDWYVDRVCLELGLQADV